jgi:hypothetical protein
MGLTVLEQRKHLDDPVYKMLKARVAYLEELIAKATHSKLEAQDLLRDFPKDYIIMQVASKPRKNTREWFGDNSLGSEDTPW